MKIGIDIDGVLTDEHGYIINNGTKFFKQNNIPFIIKNDVYDSKEIFGVSQEQYDNFWKENIIEYSKNITIRPFASEIVNKLKEKNDIYIITSRPFTTYNNEYNEKIKILIKKWLHENNIKYDYIIFSKNKADICKEKNIDIMIEDRPENVLSISKLIPVICYNNPYNENINNDNIIRCYSWYDIYDKIQNLKS